MNDTWLVSGRSWQRHSNDERASQLLGLVRGVGLNMHPSGVGRDAGYDTLEQPLSRVSHNASSREAIVRSSPSGPRETRSAVYHNCIGCLDRLRALFLNSAFFISVPCLRRRDVARRLPELWSDRDQLR
jgi:hypothetical protein